MKADRPLVRHLESPTDEARISRIWASIRAQRRERARSAGWRLVAPLAVAATAAAIGWLAWPATEAPPPVAEAPAATFEVPDRFDAVGSARRFELADGSAIELEAGSRLTTIESRGERFVTLLERGTARFEVSPGGPRRWVIESGLATVEVVGTVFEVDRAEERVDVRVERGVVLVRGERVPDRVRRLTAGQHLTVRTTPLAIAPPTAAPGPGPGPDPGPGPGPDSDLGDLDDLLTQAGTARRAGDHRRAAALLTRASRHDDPRAALAAFTLGRLEMDQLRRPARARAAFRRALQLGLPSRMEQQARTRLRDLR